MRSAPNTDVFGGLASCPARSQQANPNGRLAYALVLRNLLCSLADHLRFQQLPIRQAAESQNSA